MACRRVRRPWRWRSSKPSDVHAQGAAANHHNGATCFSLCSRMVLSKSRLVFRIARRHQTQPICAAFARLLQLNLVLYLAEVQSRESTPPRAKARHVIPAAGYVASSANMRDVEDHCSIQHDRGEQSAPFRRTAPRRDSSWVKADNSPLPSGLGLKVTTACRSARSRQPVDGDDTAHPGPPSSQRAWGENSKSRTSCATPRTPSRNKRLRNATSNCGASRD